MAMTEEINTRDYALPPNSPSRFGSAVRIARTIGLYFACVGLSLAGIWLFVEVSSPTNCGNALVHDHVGPIGSIIQAIDLFCFNMGRRPSTPDELLQIADDDPDRAKWTGPYLNDAEGLNDPWGHPFQYQITGAADDRQYHLWSIGANGIDETSDGDDDFGDDIRNWQ